MIGIIDYGMGNIHSVQKALENMGAETFVTNKPEELKRCQKIVLPGVGAFDDAMQELKKDGMAEAIIAAAKSKKTFLGICLGVQLLFETSQEAKNTRGLGLLKGSVRKFNQKGLKVPQIGWNQLKRSQVTSHKSQECPLLKNIPDNAYVYFCHSYYPDPSEKEVIAATCDYGAPFAAMVWKENIYGVQFHPEKSQQIGLTMLKNFVERC